MAARYTTRLVTAPDFAYPAGGDFELTLRVTGLSLTGKLVTFRAAELLAPVLADYSLDSDNDSTQIAISGDVITIRIAPDVLGGDGTTYEWSLLAAKGALRYSVTILSSDGDTLHARVMGKAIYVPELGSARLSPAAAPDLDLTISEGHVVSLEIATAGDSAPAFDLPATIHAATAKASLADDDEFAMSDSAASWGLKKVSWLTIRTAVSALITAAINALGLGTAATTAATDYATSAQGAKADAAKAKTDLLTVTEATDLDAIRSRVNDLDAAVVLKGAWDASAGTFPGAGAAQAGWSYIVSVAGTVGGVAFALGDRAIAIADNASTSSAADWFQADYTDQVLSVNGQTGAVVLTAGDVGAATTAQGGKADSAVQPNTTPTLTGLNIGNVAAYLFQVTDRAVSYIYGFVARIQINTTDGNFGFLPNIRLANIVPILWSSDAGVNSVSVGLLPVSATKLRVINGTGTESRDIEFRGLNLTPRPISALPDAAGNKGMRYEVNDASAPSLGATVASGGSAECEVRSNGTNWIVTAIF